MVPISVSITPNWTSTYRSEGGSKAMVAIARASVAVLLSRDADLSSDAVHFQQP